MINSYRSSVQLGMDVAVYTAMKSEIALKADIETAEGEDFELIADKCKSRLFSFIADLPIGSPLRICDMGRELLKIPGVVNYHFTSPAGDFSPALSQEVRCTDIALKRSR